MPTDSWRSNDKPQHIREYTEVISIEPIGRVPLGAIGLIIDIGHGGEYLEVDFPVIGDVVTVRADQVEPLEASVS